MNKFSGKISWAIITFFMAAIIFSFVLTGFQGFTSAPNAVASVDGTAVPADEYRNVLNQKLDQFSQMFGGKSLTNEQIRQFRIKETVLRELINQKLALNYVSSLDIKVSQKEIKDTIKNLPYFQTDGKFDVTKYKQIMANYMAPSKFEERTGQDLKLTKIQYLTEALSVSNAFVKDLQRFKQNEAVVNMVQFEKENLTKFINITDKDVKEFVADQANEAVLRSLYSSNESKYNTEEEVKARHILLRISDESKADEVLARAKKIKAGLTRANFVSIAKKETEEAAGKSSGGDLGYFSRGKMVAEFENAAFGLKVGQISEPVKSPFGYHIILVEDKQAAKSTPFEKVKNELAKTHLQKVARKELGELVDQVTAEFEKALKAKNTKELERLSQKYEATFEKEKGISLYESSTGAIDFDDKELQPIFKNKDLNANLVKKDGPTVKMLSVVSFKTAPVQEKLDETVASESNKLRAGFNQSLLEVLEQKSKIVTYPTFL